MEDFAASLARVLGPGRPEVWIQPGYHLLTGGLMGGEALLRWNSPDRGIVPASEIVPKLADSGLLRAADRFAADRVCALLRGWLDGGKEPLPISVNLAPEAFSDPALAGTICALANRWEIPGMLLNLELPERAFAGDADKVRKNVEDLRREGFRVAVDGFGREGGSLSVLRDMEVDVLKLDTGYFSSSPLPGRGESILASIVRTAKWLHIPAMAIGVERREQADFLRAVGCDFAQGFYFARPMPPADYEREMERKKNDTVDSSWFDAHRLWVSDPQMEMAFSDPGQASIIGALEDGHIELLRVNRVYYELFGIKDSFTVPEDPMDTIEREFHRTLLDACDEAVRTRGSTQCDVVKRRKDGKKLWVSIRLKYLTSMGRKQILYATLYDITAQKQSARKKDPAQWGAKPEGGRKMLVADDGAVNRAILRGIFEDRFTVLEAENGRKALEVLAENGNDASVILLDLNMPELDGRGFLLEKNKVPELRDIPVIIITSDEDPGRQVNMLALGANDYVVKPFVTEIVKRRVDNVLESNDRFRRLLREYHSVVKEAQADSLTQLYNRGTAEKLIGAALTRLDGRRHALVMLDVDNFKSVNDTYGHSYGDMVLLEVAGTLRRFFRAGDIIARPGGDEFCILMLDVPDGKMALDKCSALCCALENLRVGKERIEISCSVGIALTDENRQTFDELYKAADTALYEAKCMGKNRAALYGSEAPSPAPGVTVNRAWLNDVIDDIVNLVDCGSLEMLYMSRASQRLYHVDDYRGKKCYEVLRGEKAPCSNCPVTRSDGRRDREWYHYNEFLGRDLVFREKYLTLSGRPVKLQRVVDISAMAAPGENGGPRTLVEPPPGDERIS